MVQLQPKKEVELGGNPIWLIQRWIYRPMLLFLHQLR
jgi:hypothetical protein